ncbi:DEAD/DEAH box helicase, partial [Microbacterium halotolerans]|uniref:DEAD/DEAH box helicase n=1 Tax=Microbacterium halotolerans TaxID=246613 RepID=UPI000E6AC1CF
MPKNKKPAGGRPAKNFDPRYAKKSSHRGQSTERPGARKQRWTDEDRAGRDNARAFSRDNGGSSRPVRGGRDESRPSSRDGGGRSFDGDRRGGRAGDRFGGRGNDRFGDDRRGARGAERDDRGHRGNDRDARGGDRFERGGRSFDGDRRGNDTRHGSRFDADNRDRRQGDDRRGGRTFGDERRGDRAERGGNSFDRDRRGGNGRFEADRRGADRDARRRDADRADRGFDGGGRGHRDDRSAGERRFGDARGADRFQRGRASNDDRRRDTRGDADRGGYGHRDSRFGGEGRSGDRRPDRGGERSFGRDDRRSGSRFGRDDRSAASRDDRGAGSRFDRDDRRPGTRDDRGSRSSGARSDRSDNASGRTEHAGERAWRENREQQQAPRTRAQEDRIDVVHEKLTAQAVDAGEVAEATFADLGLGDNIVRVLTEMGATAPFPIQASTAPSILDGRDVLARGRTGSGKTIAFGAPLVERILRAQKGTKREFGRAPVALILAPTRELALQIDRTVQPIARAVGLFTTQIYGGVPQGRQVGALKKGVDIVIGTPGRIEDLHKQRKLDLSSITTSVIDEADHMCELGFLEPVQRILRLTSDGGQKLLFSATLDREVASLVDEFLTEPAVYEVAGETQETGTIDHRVIVVEHRRKAEILEQLVNRDGKTLVFTRTRAYAEMLAEQFDDAGLRAIALHGDLNQAKRTRNIERFSKGKAQVLVATDVAARGIHVDDVDLVVQADAPDEFKTYLHRAGRTGRAGNEGRVVTLIPRQRRRRMTELLGRAEIEAP